MPNNEVSLEIVQHESGEKAVITRQGNVRYYAWHGEWRLMTFPNERLVDLTKRALKAFGKEFSQGNGS